MGEVSLLVVVIISLVCERIASFSLKVSNTNLSNFKSFLLFIFSLCYLDEIIMLVLFGKFKNYFQQGLGAACYLINISYVPITSSFISFLYEEKMFLNPKFLIGLIPILSVLILVHIIVFQINLQQDPIVSFTKEKNFALLKNLLISWFLTTTYLIGLMVSSSIPYFSYYFYSYLGAFMILWVFKFRRVLLFGNRICFLKIIDLIMNLMMVFYHISFDLRVVFNRYNIEYVIRAGCSLVNWLLVFFFSQTIFIFITFLITINYYPSQIPNPYRIIYLCCLVVSLLIHSRRVYCFVINPMIFGDKLIEINDKSELIKYNLKQHSEKISQAEIIIINIDQNDENTQQELLSCVLFGFGKSEIKQKPRNTQRLFDEYEQHPYFQKVSVFYDLQEGMLETLLQNNKILPQINEINYQYSGLDQVIHYLQVLIIFCKYNQFIKITTLQNESEVFKEIQNIHFNSILTFQQVIYIQRIAFKKLVQKQINLNPNQVYYDLYEG